MFGELIEYNESFRIIASMILVNIILYVCYSFDGFAEYIGKKLDVIHSHLTKFWKNTCNTVKMGMIVGKTGWFLLKIKLFGFKPVIKEEPKPTINITKVSRNQILVEYTYNNNTYKFFSRLRRGPSNFVQFRDGEKDVTDIVTPFLGPNDDFHCTCRITPQNLGLNSLTVLDVMGEEKTFDEHDNIHL